MGKPDIPYPCHWPYKIIGADAQGIDRTIRHILANKEFDLQYSHHSKRGTYTSFNLSVRVNDETERNAIYVALREIPTVKIVI
jgi:putative lipoic acid-binding regulatory protein